MQKHFAPVGCARQGAGQSASHFYPMELLPFSRTWAASASPRVRYNPKSAEPDPDSEAWRAASGVPEAARMTLDFCKGRMLGKDDAFKVVLDPATDPGADKRGLCGSGQVLST